MMPPHFLSDRWLNTHGALRWWKSAEKDAISNNLWCSSTDEKIYAARDETRRKRCEILYSHNMNNTNARDMPNEIWRSHRNFTESLREASQQKKFASVAPTALGGRRDCIRSSESEVFVPQKEKQIPPDCVGTGHRHP
jgi:hypothetical protein